MRFSWSSVALGSVGVLCLIMGITGSYRRVGGDLLALIG